MRRYLTMLVLVGVSVGVCAAQVSRGTAEVEINGRMAQFASRMIKSVSESMFNKFLANLQNKLAENG